LNLGIEWDVDPPEPPDPVERGLRSLRSLGWTKASRMQAVTAFGWSKAVAVTRDATTAWHGVAENLRMELAVPWALAPLMQSGADLRWRATMSRLHKVGAMQWGSLPLQRRGLRLYWQGQESARHCARIRWDGAPDLAQRTLGAPWIGALATVRESAAARWGHPGLARRNAALPWGSARRTPWLVRSPDTKPPGPDPDPAFPDGEFIPLWLGCGVIGVPGLVPLNLGVTACYLVRPQRRTYVVINNVSVVRLPDRTPIQVESISISSSVDAWGSSYDIELADSAQLALLKPTAAGPRLIEINLNGYVWTAVMESYSGRREWSRTGATLAGRSRTALLAGPYAPGRVKATTEERSMAQLVDEELADTGFTASYDTVDWLVPPGAWFYDALPALDAISRLAEASGAVVQSDPAEPTLRVRARYPESPWDWRDRTPAHVLQEDIITNESLQMRSAPLYDAVVVTGELAGKGVTCKVRRAGEAGQLFAQQVSSPLINTAGAGAERGRNILADRGEQAAIDLVVPLFTAPLRPGEIGRILPLDLVEVVGEEGKWHGLCTAVRTEARIGEKAVVIEQTITLERHYSDAD